MPDNSLFISLLRPDDLLALTVELIGLAIDQSQGSPRLVRTSAGQDAFLIVHFPPQHMAESGLSANGNPSTTAAGPVMSVLAGPSRLAFRIPSNLPSIPLTLEALLDWASYELQVASNALPDFGQDTQVVPLFTQPPRPHSPAANETAIEMPYRLILSPDSSAAWAHSPKPVVSPEGLIELWHTRLSFSTKPVASKRPIVRAIWTPDLEGGPPSPQIAGSPNADQRQQIVQQSSDFGFPILIREFHVPRAIQAEKLMLSSLGGWLDINGGWQFPPGVVDPQFPSHPPFSVTEWRHIAGMGRDQYVRVVDHGSLYPTCHRASKVEITQRELALSGPAKRAGEYLVTRTHVIPLEGEKDYELLVAAYASKHGDGGEMPLRRLRLKTQTTPEQTAANTSGAFLVRDGSGAFPFHFEGEDWEGGNVDFSTPLFFVPDGVSPDASMKQFFEKNPVDLRGQSIAFANSPDKPGTTTLPTLSLTLSAQDVSSVKAQALPKGHPPFLPVVTQALVNVPAIDRFLGSSRAPGPQKMTLAESYLENGLVAGDPNNDVFVQFVDSPLLNFPPDKVGGLVSPTFTVSHLSRSLGPVPDPTKLSDFLSHIDGNLIGSVTLKDVLQAVTSTSQLPSLTTTQDANAVTTRFHWTPRIQPINDPENPATDSDLPIVTTAQTTLVIDATAIAPFDGTEPNFTAVGTLKNFGLLFLPGSTLQAVVVTFSELTFTVASGSKLALNPIGVSVEFVGPLSFVNTLAELLPPDGLNGPSLTVTSQGITAGYTLGIPAAGAGVFSLQNIAISAGLTLPFDGNPVVLELDFSNRMHPFMVTVSFIGGEGYFSISIDTHGINQIEGALGLGGNITLGLGIIEAEAHVMGGLFFHWDGSQMYFGAYLRVGASVEAFGIVGISVEIYLGLSFVPTKLIPDPDLKNRMIAENVVAIVGGIASVTIAVHLLFVTKDLSLSLERQFKIPASVHLLGINIDPKDIPGVGSFADQLLTRAAFKDPTFDDTTSLDDWRTYCLAFA
jgi:hypothetical protein